MIKEITSSSDLFSKPARARKARILAVQAIYQASFTEQNYVQVAKDFQEDHMKGIKGRQTDKKLFLSLLTLLNQQETAFRDILETCLQPKWTLPRLERVLQAILLAATAEAHLRATDIPVLINEYVQITQGFFQQDQDKLVHAVLDSLCKKI